ncbi:MAG: flagellar hook-associated protein FlgK [Selenomonadaceae bacterium]|nr:flagellar hook-associated protein FlgK [Selenomonadaceae bacterium]
MRATFSGLNTMVRGIIANQVSLDTTGHNITNAGTDGYSRQAVNLATTYSQDVNSLKGNAVVGTGVDVLSIQRARNVYADVQYRNENPMQKYYETLATNYDKVETIFDDSQDLGIAQSIGDFYQSWVDLSTSASNSSSRVNTIEQGRNLSDILQTKTTELQEQINLEYEDIKAEVGQLNDILENIVKLNKQIVAKETNGSTANDLRDSRDLLVDDLCNYLNVSVTEDDFGSYQINSSGITLVNGFARAHLEMSNGVSSAYLGTDYGITDYSIKIAESNIVFLPAGGTLKAHFDAITEDKGYIDKLANIAGYLLTAFNEQHKQGWDIDGHSTVDSTGETIPNTINFYGLDGMTYEYRYDADRQINYIYKYDEDDTTDPNNTNNKVNGEMMSGVRIIEALEVNTRFDENNGDRYIAAATSKEYVETSAGVGIWENLEWGDRTGDGTNAVYLSELFNIAFDTILSDGKANAEILQEHCKLKDTDGNLIDITGESVTEPVYYSMTNKLSINAYYQKAVSTLGTNSYSVDQNYEAMQSIMVQINNWRDSTAGVDWNEELTNMIKFQKGYSASARCLTAMDEMLDRLVNSTGAVGR